LQTFVASFKDIVALNGTPDIGDKINAPIIQRLISTPAHASPAATPGLQAKRLTRAI
jgi:hypothetical protein